MKTWLLYWNGKCIGTIKAATEAAAIRRAPMPYKQYFGEVSAILKEESHASKN